MRTIIKRKAYDTNTAELIAERSEGRWGDFEYLEEGLYRTKNGAWFISGSGGASTKYRKQVEARAWTGSSAVSVLTADEARIWLETYANDLVEDYFEAEEA